MTQCVLELCASMAITTKCDPSLQTQSASMAITTKCDPSLQTQSASMAITTKCDPSIQTQSDKHGNHHKMWSFITNTVGKHGSHHKMWSFITNTVGKHGSHHWIWTNIHKIAQDLYCIHNTHVKLWSCRSDGKLIDPWDTTISKFVGVRLCFGILMCLELSASMAITTKCDLPTQTLLSIYIVYHEGEIMTLKKWWKVADSRD